MECDVLVVGAGPAGSMAAKTAAEKNVKTILIEKNQTIGTPVRCGEGINKFLFKDTGIRKDDSFIRQKIDGTKIYFYDEVYNLTTDQWQGYVIDRKVFDKYLARQAAIAGTSVLVKTEAIDIKEKRDEKVVEVLSYGEEKKIKAKIVIGADGFESTVGRLVGIRKPWSLDEFVKGLEYEIGGLDLKENNLFHFMFGKEFPFGCGWIFPKGRDSANVGVAVSPKANAKKALEFLIHEYPKSKDMIGDNHSILEIKGGAMPISGPKSCDETVGDGVILAGDAAGIVDPITGEGITSSMISGIAAGETATSAIKNNDWSKSYLGKYVQLWREKTYCGTFKLGEDLDFLKQAQKLFFTAFTTKKVPTRVRENLISMALERETKKAKALLLQIEKNFRGF
jgi:digeranylgeranylglycerophospholipid reductase